MQRMLKYAGLRFALTSWPGLKTGLTRGFALKDRLTPRQWRSQGGASRFAVARSAIAGLISLRRSLAWRQSM